MSDKNAAEAELTIEPVEVELVHEHSHVGIAAVTRALGDARC